VARAIAAALAVPRKVAAINSHVQSDHATDDCRAFIGPIFRNRRGLRNYNEQLAKYFSGRWRSANLDGPFRRLPALPAGGPAFVSRIDPSGR
jgi:hypothetical protein